VQSHTQTSVIVRRVPATASAGWTPFAPAGEPVGWAARAFAADELPTGQVERTSFWRHDGGELAYAPPQAELAVILEGRIELLIDGRTVAEARAGEALLVPAGFDGVWITREPVTKFSAVFTADHSLER
jgi:uncharacterized cupin superfamily protein